LPGEDIEPKVVQIKDGGSRKISVEEEE
jgi:hypothetical protein